MLTVNGNQEVICGRTENGDVAFIISKRNHTCKVYLQGFEEEMKTLLNEFIERENRRTGK